MPKKNKNQRAEGLINTMNCARWLVQQFESLDCPSIARLFQRSVDDADAWIQTMAVNGMLPKECAEPIKEREAAQIHNILIKYASISDPQMRQIILGDMMDSLDKNTEGNGNRAKQYASSS